MTDMIERVARALYARRPHYYSALKLSQKGGRLVPIEWQHLDNTLKIASCQDARAAIAAMREPTEAILDAGWYTDCLQAGPNDSATIVWKAMIDAALEDK